MESPQGSFFGSSGTHHLPVVGVPPAFVMPPTASCEQFPSVIALRLNDHLLM